MIFVAPPLFFLESTFYFPLQVYSPAAATEMAAVATAAPEWATKEPCLMGIDEAGRGPVLGNSLFSTSLFILAFSLVNCVLHSR
jgi:hypothetical protein